jgi:hypothetical protein
MPNISWSNNEAGITGQFMTFNSGIDCTGTNNGSWSSCPSNRFISTRTYFFRSPSFNIALSSTVVANTSFKFSIDFVNVSSGATWKVDYELWNADTNTKVGNLNNANLPELTGNTSVSCRTWSYNPFRNPNPDPAYTNLSGNYYVRLVLTTTNTNTATSNCCTVDDIWFYYGVLSQVDAGVNGLSQPTYSTSTSNISVNSSGELLANIDFTKSIQSTINCSGSSGTGNTPLCKLSSVKGIYQINKIDKSTGDGSFVSVENITIPYQSGTYTFNKTSAKFEDSTHTYDHVFIYQDWAADGMNLEWKSIKVTPPAKPARTATIEYGITSSTSGSFGVTLNGAFCSPLSFTNLLANGYSTKAGTKCIGLLGSASGSLSVSAGSTSNSSSTTSVGCALGYKVDPVTVSSNGTNVGTTSGTSTVFTINGQQLTVIVPSACTDIVNNYCQ